MKWNELLHNVARVTPNYNFGASSNIFNLDINYDIKKQTIIFSGGIRSAKSGHKYLLKISFNHISPTEGLTDDEIAEGYMPKPNLAKDEIKVYCNCPSYKFRFDKADRANKAGLGRGFIYHRKTDRAPNNPHDLPGICYHIIEFVDYLHSQGFIH